MPEIGGDFASLLARARLGDREALDQLSREYEPKLRLVARVLLGQALRPYLDSVISSVVHRARCWACAIEVCLQPRTTYWLA